MPRFGSISDVISRLWAKAGPDGFHPLLCHLLDVGATTEALLGGSVPRAVGQQLIGLSDRRSIAAWCALHDLGKASPAFQSKRPELAARIEEDGLRVGSPTTPEKGPHGLVTVWTLPELLVNRGAHRLGARQVAEIVGAHHGLFPTPNQQLTVLHSLAGTGEWSECRGALVGSVLAAFDAEVPRQPVSPAQGVLLAGLCSVADWIGSNATWFPYASTTVPNAYLTEARRHAAEALDELRWSPWNAQTAAFSDLFPNIGPARPLQAEAETLAQELDGPTLIIMESPMGEGKTEAALVLAQALADRVGYGGFYMALPTQATANQMLSRLADFLARTLPEQIVHLQLIHGSAWLNSIANELRLAAETDVNEVYDDADRHGRVVTAEWFTQRKRGLLSPFGVGTVDQVLLAGLRAKHVFVRLFGLAGKVVIIDEAHAYDTYMSEVLDRTVEWLGALGASVIVLSATLPTSRRSELERAWASGIGLSSASSDVDKAYPLVTRVDKRGLTTSSPPASKSACVALVERPWNLAEGTGTEGLAAALIEAVENGGCVGVVCNTVASAQALFTAVDRHCEDDTWRRLAHSRFCAEDRAHWEAAVTTAFGPIGGPRPRRAILIATQVIEQSLDVDFDLLVSELAPIDLLAQRIGRLHRHPHPRPQPWAEPTCWWLGPPVTNGVPRLRRWPTGWVYDHHLLLRSWLVARDRKHMDLPGDLRALVEAVYGEGVLHPPPELAELWAETADALARKLARARAEATARFLPRPLRDLDLAELSWDPTLEDDDAHPALQALTRLGRPSLTVVCLFDVGGVVSLTRDGSRPVDLGSVPTAAMAQLFLSRSVPVSHPRFLRGLDELDGARPPAWSDSPWLRSSRVLRLQPDDTVVAIGDVGVRLDDRLGLVIAGAADDDGELQPRP